MATVSQREYGQVFDEVAVEYDRRRPGYPQEFVEGVCARAGLGPGDVVLEIGCGSGQLTRDLLGAGLQVVAVEPGAQLLSLAAGNLEDLGAVTFVNARFEDAPLPNGSFRAVFAGSSFHWIDPEFSWAKVAELLAPGGTLALIQHCGLQGLPGLDDQDSLLSILARIAPEIAAVWPTYRDLPSLLEGVEHRRENISEVWSWIGSYDLARAQAGRLFEELQVLAVPIPVEQTAEELNALFSTLSYYKRLSLTQRQLLRGEFVALQERLGRPLRSSTAAVLVTARVG
ncbi:MAG TPA: class I SAM-dependent methyltransferase [Solirubrobacteraceae bacterium]|jgi:SAM-dependent methyltransferase|nr:class I SAM-dependent methyltransferase [Solirubrobacteraceae bacterium]